MDLSLDLQAVIARLDTLKAGGTLKKVGGAIDIPSAEDALRNQLPAAFVVPGREQGSGERPRNSARQMIVESFNVVQVLSNKRDAQGVAAHADLRALRGAVQGVLLGWSPDAAVYDTFMFDRGALLSISELQLWWVDTYHTRRYLDLP